MPLQLTSYIDSPIQFCIGTVVNGKEVFTRKSSMCLVSVDDELGTLTYSIWDDESPGSRRYATVEIGHDFVLNVNDAEINHKVGVSAYANVTEYGEFEVSISAPEEVRILRNSIYNAHMNERIPGRYERHLKALEARQVS